MDRNTQYGLVLQRTKRILYLFPGPKYNIEHDFKKRLEGLSRYCEGILLVSGPEQINVNYGSFNLNSLKADKKNLVFTGRYFVTALFTGMRMKKEGGLDLVVAYDPLRTGLMGLVISRILGIKLAVEVNGDFSAWENYTDIKNELLRKLKRKLYMSVERFVLKRADGIKLLYPAQIDFCKADLPGRVINIFPAYVDLTPFKNIEEEKIVLFAGFPFYIKGLDILIPAFKKLSSKFPDWKLKIIGWFPDTTLLDEYIGENKQIYYHPPVPHNEMPEHVGRCGLLVLPSRTETMGRVLLEAMSAGKARIAANVGGIPTTINDGEDGILFESENIEQLSECMLLLMGNHSLRRELGEAGERRARNEFTMDRYFSNMNKHYTEILCHNHKES